MGSFCTSGPQNTTTNNSGNTTSAGTSNQAQTYNANPLIAGAGAQAIGAAQDAASQPFQTPAAPVAGFNPFQQQAFSQYQGLQGGLNPYVQNANTSMNTASAPITQGDVAGFQNPYSDQALANLKKYVFDPQRTQTMGAATQAAGGVGADRLALTSQNLDKTQSDALSQANAGFYGQALSAAQQSKQQALQSAQGWLGLGLGNQTGQLQATGALAGAGAQQQAQSQAELMSPYEQTLARIAYPYQQSQFLAGITGGLAGAMGGTTVGGGTTTGAGTSQTNGITSAYAPQPSLFNQILGGAGIGLGAYNAFGGGGGSGGYSTSTPNSPGAAMYNGSPTQAGFGPTYADGGSVEENPFDLIPNIPLHDTSGEAHNNLNLTPPPPPPVPPPPTPAPASGGSGSSSSGGDAMKMAAQLLPMFLASGGSVNPWEAGQGYAPGGDVEEVDPDEYNRFDEAAPPPAYSPFIRPNRGPSPSFTVDPPSTTPREPPRRFNYITGQPLPAPSPSETALAAPSNVVSPAAAADMPPQASGPQGPTAPDQNPWNVPANAGRLPMPSAYTRLLPSATPPAPQPQPPSVAKIPQPPDRSGGYGPRPGSINSDMKISDFQMPKDQEPYPDSLSRDWGQKAVRSPWMALIEAGAKMAQSTKSGIGGLGEGAEAGIKHLDMQRKELRSEQQINQKADELYRHARSELNKYTRKTPHELATEHYRQQSLDQGKYGFVNYTDPETNQVRVARTDTRHGTMVDTVTGKPVTGGHIVAKGAQSNQASAIAEVQKQHPDWPIDKVLAFVKNPNFAGGQAMRVYAQDPRSMSQDAAIRNKAWAEAHQQTGATVPTGTMPPSQQAIQALKVNPEMRAEFDTKYGAGSAAKILGE